MLSPSRSGPELLCACVQGELLPLHPRPSTVRPEDVKLPRMTRSKGSKGPGTVTH